MHIGKKPQCRAQKNPALEGIIFVYLKKAAPGEDDSKRDGDRPPGDSVIADQKIAETPQSEKWKSYFFAEYFFYYQKRNEKKQGIE